MTYQEKQELGLFTQNLREEQKAQLFDLVYGYYSAKGGSEQERVFLHAVKQALWMTDVEKG